MNHTHLPKELSKTKGLILNNLPTDKSITHRALLLAAISQGTCTINDYLSAGDTHATIKCLKNIGITIKSIKSKVNSLKISGNPEAFYRAKNLTLDCKNSGTTLRHLCAMLVGSMGNITLKGDSSLNSRPMERIVTPLKKLGALISYLNKNAKTAPIKIQKADKLLNGKHHLKIASAQIKSSLLFYAILNRKKILLTGKLSSRDHTENLLTYLGIKYLNHKKKIQLNSKQNIPAFSLRIPADPSTTLYYLFIFTMTQKDGKSLILGNHYYNITRCYSWDLLEKSGHYLRFYPDKNLKSFEKIGVLHFKKTIHRKSGFNLPERYNSYVIDELPLLMTWALFLDTKSIFRNPKELIHKESDRLKEVQKIFQCFGVEEHFQVKNDKIIIIPIKKSQLVIKSKYNSHDHRMVMLYHSLLIICGNPKKLTNIERKTVNVSNPQWESDSLKIFNWR